MSADQNQTSLLEDMSGSNAHVDSNAGLIRLSEPSTGITSASPASPDALSPSSSQQPSMTSSATASDAPMAMMMNAAEGDAPSHGTNEGGAHPHDPDQQGTHTALLDLVPHSQATHIAIKNGSWFDASTWQGGKIPTDGAQVLIKEGVAVTYNQESDARLDSIRVDGSLKFASNADTKVLVDTFVVAPDGQLDIGSKDNPVDAGVKTQIIFTADGAIDRAADPTLLGRGLISHGKARIYGADKTDFLALQGDVAAGDNALVLKGTPKGWQVGDQIVLGGTNHRYGQSDEDNSRFQDEELTITKIEGNRVSFTNNDITSGDNTVLRFDHQLPDIAEKGELELYVANTTRNVSFETENADSVSTQQRAHVMFMHNPDVVVENAGFYNLGRSDKSKIVDDPGENVDGSSGNGSNRRGRYGLHFHRTGAEDITGTPAIARGNAVVGTPGWGIVHHDSNAVLESNVVFDVVGSGIVAESGNEQGVWKNNLTIKTTGVSFDNIDQTRDARDRLFDLGFKGEGYWVQGAAQVAMIGNTAISANDAGITLFGDTLDPEGDFRDKDTISVDLLPPEIRALVAPAGQTEVDITDVPFRQVTGFQSYNTRTGIDLWANKTNFDGQLEFNSPDPTTAHNLRSTIEDFAVWGVRGTGVKVQYSSHVDIKDGLVVGDPSDPDGRGIFENHASFNIDFDNLNVQGFEEGLSVEFPNQTKDFIASSIANSSFSNNKYNLAAVGGEPLGPENRPDDFPANFKIINTKFAEPDDNAAPVAKFSSRIVGGLAASFDASGSYDSDPLKADGKSLSRELDSNAIAAYGWDFNNDGKIDKFGRQVSHHFDQAGSKKVALTVWDSQGGSQTLAQTIDIKPANYTNPFKDASFSDNIPFGEGYKASSLGSELGWLATNKVRRGSSNGNDFAVLSSSEQYGGGLAQVIYDNKIRRGKQTLGLKLKNTEGSGKINNEIDITLWGVNGQFKNAIYDTASPYQVGTLPFQGEKLIDVTLGGETFDWKDFQWNVDLKNGYDYLLAQVNTRATKDGGDFVGVDDVRLFGDGTSTPTASDIPSGNNRFYISGTEANDRLSGSDRDQSLEGKEGDDVLKGLGGEDSLYGGVGNDELRGDDGNDKLYGEDGNDFLGGGKGDDTLNGGEGNDLQVGWEGDDVVYGADGQDTLYGSNGNDNLNGAVGNDFLRGGAGNDSLYGDVGDDFLGGGDGNDTLNGGDGNDTLVGWKGNDTLYGGTGIDQLYGSHGNDSLNSGAGDDLLRGGQGSDTLWAAEGNDNLGGGADSDTVLGGDGNDTLAGGLGNDSLDGGKGNDQLIGVETSGDSAGRGEQDLLTDWNGNDTFVLGDANGVFYNDGRDNTLGAGDYAQIRGFQQSNGDKIQLHGQAADYRLGAVPTGLQSGAALFLNTPGNTDELVAVIAFANPDNLDLKSSSFAYV